MIKISSPLIQGTFFVVSQRSPTMVLKLLSIRLCKNSTGTKGNRASGDSLHIMACFSIRIGLQSVAYPSKDCNHITVDIVQREPDRLPTRSSRRCIIMGCYLLTFSSSHKSFVICQMSSKEKLYYLIQITIFEGLTLKINDCLVQSLFYSYRYFLYF